MKTPEENRAYQRAHYHANKEKWREKRLRWEKKMRALVLEAKDRFCTDCSERWPAIVMQYDHRPGTDKKFNIGDLRSLKLGLKAVVAEIAKCDVLCPTCHTIRTLQRLGLLPVCCCSSMVERVLGKDEVSGFKSQQQLWKKMGCVDRSTRCEDNHPGSEATGTPPL